MRTIEQLTKEIKDEEIVHGSNSEIVGKLKSLLGLAWIDEDLDTGVNLLFEASAMFHHMESQYPETELDVDYRLADTLEVRANTEEQMEESKRIMSHVIEKRKELDADRSRAPAPQPYASEDEEIDSTLIYFDEAVRLQQAGHLSAAESLFEQCLQLRYIKFGAIAAANVNVLLSFSDLLREIGNFAKAEDILNLALKSSVIGRSRINLKTAEALNSLGNLLRIRTDFDKAEESLNEALNIRKEIFAENHIQVAATLNNIAELKRERGDNIAAVGYHLKAIQLFESLGGPTHPGTINAKGNYGITLHRLARLSDVAGLENVNNAMEFMYTNGYDDQHPWLLKFSNETILSEARHNAARGDYEVSVERYDAVIARKLERASVSKKQRQWEELSELDRLALQELQQERFVMLLSWCDASLRKCRFATAATLIEKCDTYAAAYLKIGSQKRDEVFWLAQLAFAKAQYARVVGNLADALQHASRASSLLDNHQEESHLLNIAILQLMALLHVEWAHYSEARPVLDRINRLLKLRVGKDSGTFGKAPLTVTLSILRARKVEALYGLATGSFDIAHSKLTEMESVIQAHHLQEHEIYGEYLLVLSKLERVRGSHAKVVYCLEQAQSSIASHYGKEHLYYAEMLQGLGWSQSVQGSFTNAMNAIMESAHILENMMPAPSQQHPVMMEQTLVRAQVLHSMDRLHEAKDNFDKVVKQSATTFGENPHPLNALALEGLGSVCADLYDFKAAKEYHEAALVRWQLLCPDDSGHLHALASCKFARCLAQMKHYRPTPAVLQSVGVAIEYVQTSISRLRSDGASFLLAELLALKGRILLEQGELELAQQTIGAAGAQLRSYFQSCDSPKTYEFLLLSAQVTMALGKYRDAKVQISFAFARLQLLYGPLFASHRKLLEAYFVAAENMRQVGYFFDAVECIDVAEERIAKKFGVTSNEMMRVHFFQALIQRDFRRLSKSEEKLMVLEERIRSVYGVASKFYFDWKYHLAKCLTMQNKQSRATGLLQELLQEMESLLGPAPLVRAMLVNDLCYQSIVLKPNDQQLAMQQLKEEVLPVVTKVFGAGSMVVLHVRGRIALFMNIAKKDSGRKALFETLKGFDDLKPFNLPYDHPYVLELGGYEKPSSKDRVSKNVQEEAFYSWANVDVTSENAADFLPKSLFVDVDNNDPTLWGSVHYYGVDLFNQGNVVGHGGRKGRGDRRSSRSRSPSPSGAGNEKDKKAVKAKSSGQIQALVRENESLEDALIREHRARRDVEDEIVGIKHEKSNLEEALDAERVETLKLTKDLEAQHMANDLLNAKLSVVHEEMAALKKQLEDVQAELQRRIDLEAEAERRRKEDEEMLLAEQKRRAEEVAYLADHPELIQPEDNPVYKSDLEAASFLFHRAQNLHDRGLYYKAKPFYDESCAIRERILTIAKRTTMETIRAKARNLIRMSEFVQADGEFHRIQVQEAEMYGVESDFYLQLALDTAQSKMYQGFYSQAKEILDSASKTLNLKSQNTGEASRMVNQLFGQCMTLQGYLNLHAGKINEAKAQIERGQALISRAHGVNNLMFVESLMVKIELLVTLGKGKEAVALLDQTIMTVKALVKAAEDAAANKDSTDKTASDGTHDEDKQSDDAEPRPTSATKKLAVQELHHPLVAECLLLYARAAMVMSFFSESKRRFTNARNHYLKFFENIDSRLFPIAIYEAQLQLTLCEYREARVTLTPAILMLEKQIHQYGNNLIPTPLSLGQLCSAMATLEANTGHLDAANQCIHQVAGNLTAFPTSIPIFEARMLELRLALLSGKHLQVKEPLEEIMESIRNSLGKEHVLAIYCQLLYGESFLIAGEFDEADKYFQRSIKTMRTNFPDGNPMTVECAKRLVMVSLQRQSVELSHQYIGELQLAIGNIFGAFLEHDIYPHLLAFEAKAMLLELLYGPPPAPAPIPETAASQIIGEDAPVAPAEGQSSKKQAAMEDIPLGIPSSEGKEAATMVEAGANADGDHEGVKATEPTSPPDTAGIAKVDDQASQQDSSSQVEEKGEKDDDEIEPEIVLPVFHNEAYQAILDKLDDAIQRFEAVFASIRLSPHNLNDVPVKPVAPAAENQALWMMGAPFITYLRGVHGQVELLEYVALQEYIRSLTTAEREYYYNVQATKNAKGRRFVPGKALKNPMVQQLPDPEGKKVMERSLSYLRKWGLMDSHPFIVELESALRELQLQYDEMEIANFLFQRGKALKGMGKFQDADRLFDESFAMFFKCFGPMQSGQSTIMSEILLEKAETGRYLSKKVDFITSMHLLSIHLYRTNHGGEITDEFVLRNLLSMTNLLMDQHLFDDALSTYRQFEIMFGQVYGESPTAETFHGKPVDRSKFFQLVQIKIFIAECLTKTHRYEDATKVSAEALELIKLISGSMGNNMGVTTAGNDESNFTLAYLLVQIYLNDMQLMDATGNFDASEQLYRLIDTIFVSWEQHEVTPNSVHFAEYALLKAKALSLRAEHFFTVHRLHEATRTAEEAYAIRNSLLNRVAIAAKEGEDKAAAATSNTRSRKTVVDRKSKDREEEIRLNFMNAMDSLLTAGLQRSREKNAAGTPSPPATAHNKGLHHTEAEKETVEENALEDEINAAMKDVRQTFQDAKSNEDDDTTSFGETADSSSGPSAANDAKKKDVEQAANLVQFSVMDYMGQQDRVYLWQGVKISGHAMIAESLLFEARLATFVGNVAKAKEALEICQTMLNTLYVKKSMFKLDVTYAYGELRVLQNQLEDSKKIHLKVLEARLSLVANRADVCLEISDSLFALARAYLLICQYDDAMQYINDALKIDRRCWSNLWKKPDAHYRVQKMLITCAEILVGKGFFVDAQGMLTATISSLKGMYGDLHLDIAVAMARKALNACELGQYDEALSALQQAKSIALVIVGDSHYFMGVLHNYVSQALRYTGKIVEAKEQLDLAVVAIRSQLGKHHYLTVLTLLDIGLNFLDLGKYITCQHVLNRALHLLKKSLGKDHIAVAQCLFALGELHMKMGIVEPVPEFFEQSLYIIRKVVGSDRFPLVALIMSSRCELFGTKGLFEQAVQGMDDAIALMKLIYDSGNHYFIAKSTVALARIFLQQGKFHDAKVMFDRAFVTMKTTYGRDHPLLFESQLGVADCLMMLGRVEQAKALFERCLNGFKDWKGSSHPAIATVLNRMGDVLTLLCRFDAAESVLLEAWGIRVRVLKEANENHPDIAETLISLAVLLRQRGTIGMTKEELQAIADSQNPNKGKGRHNRDGNTKKKTKKRASEEEFGMELLDDALLFGDALLPHGPKQKKGTGEGKAADRDDDDEGERDDGDGDDDDDDDDEIIVVGGNEDDDDGDMESMPSIQISAIEKLDADHHPPASALDAVPEYTGLDDGGSVIPPPATLDAAALKEDKKLYAAIPLLEKAQQHQLAYYDEHHPSILSIRYHLAECTKARGLFEESLVQHEGVFNLRRKVLGDDHLDTLLSLVAILDVLRLSKRVFPPGKGAGGFFANTAPNNSDAAQLAAAKSAGQVTLVDHLASLTLPLAPSRKKQHRSGEHGEQEVVEEGFIAEDATLKALNKLKRGVASPTVTQNWRFLSKMIDPSMLPPDQQPNKKKKPLPLPKGYMGYQFPPMKQNDQHHKSTTGGSLLDAADGSGNPTKEHYNPLHDAKKVSDLCLSVFRKLFAPEYEALGLRKKDEHYDHPAMALILFCKAEIYRLRADGSYAMKYAEQSLAMRRRIFRTHHPVISDCLIAVAEMLRTDQRFAQALPIYDKALEIRRETYPKDDHPCIAEVYSALALVAIGQGRYVVAKGYLEQAKAICDGGHMNTTHPALAVIHNNYAILLQAQGHLKEALQSYRRALSIKQKVFGALHPETAATMNNMGLLLKAQGRLEAAVTVFQKTLDIQRKVFGQRHPDVATTENNLAAILSQQEGQKFAAKELLKASLITRTEIFGSEHAVVASTMNNLAVLLFTLGEIGQAKEYFEDALKIRRKLLGEDHPGVAEVQHNLGYWFYAQGYLVEAKRCYEDALRIRRRIYTTATTTTPTPAAVMISSAALGDGGAVDGAAAAVPAEDTAQQRRAKSLAVAVTALHLSGVCEQAGDLARALEYIEEAHQIRYELLGELHVDTVVCKKSLTYIQQRLQQQQEKQRGLSSSAAKRNAAANDSGGKETAAVASMPAVTTPKGHLGFETSLGEQSVCVGEENPLV
jgi:tetratricopeptide (TPR) repeat protein